MMTFEAEFGEIKIPKIRTKIFNSKTEENEFFVIIWDAEGLLSKTNIPKGTVRVVHSVEVPPNCPHCGKELPDGVYMRSSFKDIGVYEYGGVTVKAMNNVGLEYGGNVVELCLHYEVMEYHG